MFFIELYVSFWLYPAVSRNCTE